MLRANRLNVETFQNFYNTLWWTDWRFHIHFIERLLIFNFLLHFQYHKNIIITANFMVYRVVIETASKHLQQVNDFLFYKNTLKFTHYEPKNKIQNKL